uniref:Bromodomain protein n=1 Tax=Strongyloides venezuelensis TaxID=75913 RepID=A0A0K0FN85_STRVS
MTNSKLKDDNLMLEKTQSIKSESVKRLTEEKKELSGKENAINNMNFVRDNLLSVVKKNFTKDKDEIWENYKKLKTPMFDVLKNLTDTYNIFHDSGITNDPQSVVEYLKKAKEAMNNSNTKINVSNDCKNCVLVNCDERWDDERKLYYRSSKLSLLNFLNDDQLEANIPKTNEKYLERKPKNSESSFSKSVKRTSSDNGKKIKQHRKKDKNLSRQTKNSKMSGNSKEQRKRKDEKKIHQNMGKPIEDKNNTKPEETRNEKPSKENLGFSKIQKIDKKTSNKVIVKEHLKNESPFKKKENVEKEIKNKISNKEITKKHPEKESPLKNNAKSNTEIKVENQTPHKEGSKNHLENGSPVKHKEKIKKEKKIGHKTPNKERPENRLENESLVKHKKKIKKDKKTGYKTPNKRRSKDYQENEEPLKHEEKIKKENKIISKNSNKERSKKLLEDGSSLKNNKKIKEKKKIRSKNSNKEISKKPLEDGSSLKNTVKTNKEKNTTTLSEPNFVLAEDEEPLFSEISKTQDNTLTRTQTDTLDDNLENKNMRMTYKTMESDSKQLAKMFSNIGGSVRLSNEMTRKILRVMIEKKYVTEQEFITHFEEQLKSESKSNFTVSSLTALLKKKCRYFKKA